MSSGLVSDLVQERQELNERQDATRNMLLEDIEARDKDNISLVWKDCRPVYFDTAKEAGLFMGAALGACLRKLGVNIDKAVKQAMAPVFRYHKKGMNTVISPQTDVDMQLMLKGVRVERRVYPNPEDAVRSGLYVYHANEIAYFVSEPFGVKTLEPALKKFKGKQVVDMTKPKREWDRLVVYTNYRK